MPVVLVTGGARGIGRGIAERFLSEGWQVAILDSNAALGRKTVRELAARGDVVFVGADVSREAAVRRALRQVVGRFGRLDALVNNAGIADPYSGFDAKRWQRILDVNLTGPFLCSKIAAPYLRRAHGRIVNIASTRALMSEPETPAYAASKGGLVALTHSLAVTFGPEILVNCISPGWIDTGWTKLRPIDHRQHPAGRVGRPEDVAALVSYLVSPEAGFMTGQNIILDGGMTRKMIYAE